MGQLHSIRYRRDTATNWASVNPVLQEGEPGYETDTGVLKIGDGVTAYNSLGAIFHSEIEALENDIQYATTIKQAAIVYDNAGDEQIDTQTVNTQVATPASVSIEGVTTTDNVDQSLDTSGQTYSLGTSIDEGATHRQTFTPTADRGDGKHILTKIQALVAASGTGDWTLTVHDSSNNVLASQTIVNGSMSTGDVDFDVPAILDVGTAYHFHITSTVADGTVTTTTLNDLETVDYHAHFAKHTESPIIEANGAKLDLTGTKLLTGATITVNNDGRGKYEWKVNGDDGVVFGMPVIYPDGAFQLINDAESVDSSSVFSDNGTESFFIGDADNTEAIYKIELPYTITSLNVGIRTYRNFSAQWSTDGINYTEVASTDGSSWASSEIGTCVPMSSTVYLKITSVTTGTAIQSIYVEAELDCTNVQLPLFVPSSEVQSETLDFVQNPIDISEGQFWQLSNDLTGWGSRTITMLSSEATFESQAVSSNTIYVYDSNGTTAWTWDERNGLVPPADRTSGTVVAKFLVGDNQIKSSVNDGSMKANFNLAWDEESLRAAINRLTDLVNLQYPIVMEVEDVPAIDLQAAPSGATAQTGYTNDVTSLRQSSAGVAAIAYSGLLPAEDRFSEWLDVVVECDDGDGTLQGKLYTADGTLIATYADLEANPVLSISDPDYKYSRQRLVLQISASTETTSTAWSVSKVTWRYQYNG